jgi:hypothetical protein
MARKSTLLALVLTPLITAGTFAQSSAEFGRVSGGQIVLAVKAPSQFSGSLGLTMSRSNGGSALSSGLSGYGATFGGTVVKDRLWFFATADHNAMQFPSMVSSIPRFSSNVLADLGNRNSLGASLRTQRNITSTTIPSSFLSLRYTGIVSSNMFVTATVSQTSGHAQ